MQVNMEIIQKLEEKLISREFLCNHKKIQTMKTYRFVSIGSRIASVFYTYKNCRGIDYRKSFVEIASLNPSMPTVPTFAVRDTDVSRHNGGTSGPPLKPLRDDSALRALSSLRRNKTCYLDKNKITCHMNVEYYLVYRRKIPRII